MFKFIRKLFTRKKYAIMVEWGPGDYIYVMENFSSGDSKPLIFSSKSAAEKAGEIWKKYKIVEYK